MRVIEKIINKRFQCGKVMLSGDTFACQFRVEWQSEHYGVYPRHLHIMGVEIPHLRFGFASPWGWALDLDVHETNAGPIVAAQGYQSFTGGRIPFMRNTHCFFGDPEMLYQTATFHHLEKKTYVISGVEYDWLRIDPAMKHASLQMDGVTVHWQFAPAPVVAEYVSGLREWVLEFESAHVEALLLWSADASPKFPRFRSSSGEIDALETNSDGNSRVLDTRMKHMCAGPDDWISLPPGEVMMAGIRAQKKGRVQFENGLWDMTVRHLDGDSVSIGSARVFSLDRLAESEQFPMLRPYMVRGLRSLKERMLFDVVPEDDPEQYYQWGTGTWPRCFSVLSLDYFGFHQEAHGYLQFMLDASRQFQHLDGLAHLWDVFSIRGPYLGDMLYDINGHAIKLYEAGKFYLNHRGDSYGIRLLEEHYDILQQWCAWIERHMNEEGLVQDATESNLWNFGFGTFTQAPAAAGVRLFLNLAEDKGRPEDRARFAAVVDRLMRGLETGLFGDGGNPYIGIPEGVGDCHTTYVPNEDQPNIRGERARRIGLSCYSLAANFFLQDPDVGLLSPDDPRATQTLELALGHLGDPFDPRIIRWHAGPSHMGYGQGQILMALVHAGRAEEFRHRLQGLFDVSHKEVGDPYLMQEILNRAGFPNRGNKAHLTYFPLLAARLAGFTGISDGNRFVPDLKVTGGQPAT